MRGDPPRRPIHVLRSVIIRSSSLEMNASAHVKEPENILRTIHTRIRFNNIVSRANETQTLVFLPLPYIIV